MRPDDILERTQWDYFWVPGDVQVTDRPELLYYSCPRDVPTLNVVTRTRAEPERLPDLIEEVSQSHRKARSRWLVRDLPDWEPLKLALQAAGYSPHVHTFASAIDVKEHESRPVQDIVVRQVLDMPTLRDCVAVSEQAFPGTRVVTEEELARDLQIATAGTRVHRFVAYDRDTGKPLSSGGMTLFPALRFGFLWAGGTIPEARGRGAYSAVLRARVERARDLGFEYVGLYAAADTSAPIVLRQGFKRYGAMTYWERPIPPA
ncbi:MAG TPA: hypothetical protein VFX78_14100 [Candidatus Eisenbacteria bacterium]|nr:hypothetical protein [Candidatus Eisenbacteria bacterium]